MSIKSVRDLEVYRLAFELAMNVFELTKKFPKEEKYSLTNQIRRSSRSVCGNLDEVWAKRRYKAHFISKLTDVDGENSETATWLRFAKDCGYLSPEEYIELANKCIEFGKMVGSMLMRPEPFLLRL